MIVLWPLHDFSDCWDLQICVPKKQFQIKSCIACMCCRGDGLLYDMPLLRRCDVLACAVYVEQREGQLGVVECRILVLLHLVNNVCSVTLEVYHVVSVKTWN